MDHRVVELREELRSHLRDTLPQIVDDRYFEAIDFRPKYPEDLLKATRLQFIRHDDAHQELRFVDEIFTEAEIIVDTPHFEEDPDSAAWLDRIVSFSIRFECPDVDLTHDDVLQWERYRRDGDRTGRLFVADARVTEDDIGPVPGIERGIEFGLREMLPDHEGRSEERASRWSSSNGRPPRTGLACVK